MFIIKCKPEMRLYFPKRFDLLLNLSFDSETSRLGELICNLFMVSRLLIGQFIRQDIMHRLQRIPLQGTTGNRFVEILWMNSQNSMHQHDNSSLIMASVTRVS